MNISICMILCLCGNVLLEKLIRKKIVFGIALDCGLELNAFYSCSGNQILSRCVSM